jgi:uncharacterized Zn finger protein (UPF0148 family)
MTATKTADPFCPKCGERLLVDRYGNIYCPAEFQESTQQGRRQRHDRLKPNT